MRIFLLLLLCVPGALNYALCANDTPLRYRPLSEYEGRLLLSSDEGKYHSFLVLPKVFWQAESGLLYTWNGIERDSAIGANLNGAEIRNLQPVGSKALVLLDRDRKISLGILDEGAQLSWETAPGISGPLSRSGLMALQKEEFLLLADRALFHISLRKGEISLRKLSEETEAVIPLSGTGKFAYMEKKGARGILKICDGNGNCAVSQPFYMSENIFLRATGSYVVVCEDRGTRTHAEFFDFQAKKKFTSDIPAAPAYFLVGGVAVPEIFTLREGEKFSVLSKYALTPGGELKESYSRSIDAEFFSPQGLTLRRGIVFLVYLNGIVSFRPDGKTLSKDFLPLVREFGASIPDIDVLDGYLLLATPSKSILLYADEQPLWFFYSFLNRSGRILLPAFALLVIILSLRIYFRQRELIRSVLDLPGSGYVFVLDSDGRLTSVNQPGRELLGISLAVPLRRMFRYYCAEETFAELRSFAEGALAAQSPVKERIAFRTENSNNELVASAMPLRGLTGRFHGAVLTVIDITQELERKRLVNWAQLAHDMQTNLSVIRLNAEQLEAPEEAPNSSRRKKILFQVGLLIQRVRDLVTVGKSDQIEKLPSDSLEICLSVREEFDAGVFPHVSFSVKAETFIVYCDRNRLVRGLRNAVENGIRALKGKEGELTLAAWQDRSHAYFSIRDTGVGMDEDLRQNMLKPYFTTSRNEGGTGIGTMIIQHVVEIHGGELIVNSEKNKGTEIIFKLPNQELPGIYDRRTVPAAGKQGVFEE